MDPPDPKALRILAVVQRIPPGRVATYGDVARAARLPGRARLVGRVLRDAPLEWDIPWHRVVNAAGRVSERDDPACARRQRTLLSAEGVEFSDRLRIDLARYRWNPSKPKSGAPRR